MLLSKTTFSFSPTFNNIGQNKKYDDEEMWRDEDEKEPWEYGNGKRSVCNPLKMSFTAYGDVKRDSCSISMISSILA
jgi:hypothetical protein